MSLIASFRIWICMLSIEPHTSLLSLARQHTHFDERMKLLTVTGGDWVSC